MEVEASKINPQKWLERYGDLLYQYALPRVNKKEIAEDLVQETYLSALKGVSGFKGEASEKNWLFAILKNKIIDFYRKKATLKEASYWAELQETGDEWFDEHGNWVENRLPKEWKAVEGSLERKEFQKIINLCKENLKTLQKQVFTLKYIDELDSDEICKVLDISTSNYWVLIHRARLQMRDCVEKNWL